MHGRRPGWTKQVAFAYRFQRESAPSTTDLVALSGQCRNRHPIHNPVVAQLGQPDDREIAAQRRTSGLVLSESNAEATHDLLDHTEITVTRQFELEEGSGRLRKICDAHDVAMGNMPDSTFGIA